MLSRGIGVHHGGLLPILKVNKRRLSRRLILPGLQRRNVFVGRGWRHRVRAKSRGRKPSHVRFLLWCSLRDSCVRPSPPPLSRQRRGVSFLFSCSLFHWFPKQQSHVLTGDCGDLLQPRAGKGAVRHGDVRDGSQHAGQDRGVQWHQEARRERLPVHVMIFNPASDRGVDA